MHPKRKVLFFVLSSDLNLYKLHTDEFETYSSLEKLGMGVLNGAMVDRRSKSGGQMLLP